MRASTLLILGGVGLLGFVLWQRTRVPAAPGQPSRLDALTQGLRTGIEAGTYDANAIRNQMMSADIAQRMQFT